MLQQSRRTRTSNDKNKQCVSYTTFKHPKESTGINLCTVLKYVLFLDSSPPILLPFLNLLLLLHLHRLLVCWRQLLCFSLTSWSYAALMFETRPPTSPPPPFTTPPNRLPRCPSASNFQTCVCCACCASNVQRHTAKVHVTIPSHHFMNYSWDPTT